MFTLFAPDDEAFEDLLKRLKMTEEELLAKPFLLTRVLNYHIIGGQVIEEGDMDDGVQLETEVSACTLCDASGAERRHFAHSGLQTKQARFPPIIGKRMKVTVRRGADDSIVLDGNGSDARVVETDRQACAAIVHVIDTVLLPDKLPVATE